MLSAFFALLALVLGSPSPPPPPCPTRLIVKRIRRAAWLDQCELLHQGWMASARARGFIR